MTLTLRSPAFEPGAPIPARFDHERGDLSPALTWDGVPEGTAGLVLLVDDPDAPVQGSFVHWVLCNLDPARRGVAEGEVPAEATAAESERADHCGYALARAGSGAEIAPSASCLACMLGWSGCRRAQKALDSGPRAARMS
jgi:hypothetical protein